MAARVIGCAHARESRQTDLDRIPIDQIRQPMGEDWSMIQRQQPRPADRAMFRVWAIRWDRVGSLQLSVALQGWT